MNLYEYQPQKTFSQRHMLCLQDYTPDEIYQVLSLALKLKGELKAGIPIRSWRKVSGHDLHEILYPYSGIL